MKCVRVCACQLVKAGQTNGVAVKRLGEAPHPH